MPACKDLTGQTFNLLTVLRKTEKRQNNSVVWECQCECGNICEVTSSNLTKNRTKSCGCLNHKPVFKDLSNQRFGKLVAIEPTYKKNNHRSMIWKCKCDCGNIYEVAAENLLKGTKSCGCYTSEWQKEWGKTRRYDLTNKKFGKLTALYIQEDNDKQRVWHCICECGNECNIEARYLLNGHTKSCGCLSISYGAYSIEQILKNNNIYFEKEKTFNTCKFDDTQYLARFDFFVENKYIIEFDGIQHFEPRCFGGISEEEAQKAFEKVIKHDKYKNNWCKQNNIPLIRIPYWHRNIQLKNLTIEESEFIYE